MTKVKVFPPHVAEKVVEADKKYGKWLEDLKKKYDVNDSYLRGLLDRPVQFK